MPIKAAWTGESLAVPIIRSILFGTGAARPSGGLRGVISGTGIGIRAFVAFSWIKINGSVLDSELKLKVKDSTFVWASILMLSAGCGAPIFISAPQYAMLMPGAGPGSM